MSEMKFEGKVTTSQEIETHTEDTDKKEGKIIISTDNGEKITIKGAAGIVTGFGPKVDVTVKLIRSQRTISETPDLKKKK